MTPRPSKSNRTKMIKYGGRRISLPTVSLLLCPLHDWHGCPSRHRKSPLGNASEPANIRKLEIGTIGQSSSSALEFGIQSTRSVYRGYEVRVSLDIVVSLPPVFPDTVPFPHIYMDKDPAKKEHSQHHTTIITRNTSATYSSSASSSASSSSTALHSLKLLLVAMANWYCVCIFLPIVYFCKNGWLTISS